MNSPSGLSKRKLGRPLKHRSDSGSRVQDQMPNVQPNDAEPLSSSPGLRNHSVAVPSPPPTESSTATPKRGRGRPPKVGATGGHATVSGGADPQGVETGSENPASKRKMMSAAVGVKRVRGRPRRIQNAPVTVPLSGNVLRRRGRPKKKDCRPNVAVNGGTGDSGLGSSSSRRSAINIAKLIEKTLGRRKTVAAGTAILVTDPRQLVVCQ